MVTIVNDQEFESTLQSNPKVIVKYFANWCGTCKLFSQKYKKLSDKEEFKDVLFIDINAEENPIARKIAGVSNLPFFATFKDGKLVRAEATAKEEGVISMIEGILKETT
jgi:thiol-disulfide isomerase/thioredoxin